jgi:hypothetical protein
MRQATVKRTATTRSTAGTTTTQTRKSGSELVLQRVRRTRRPAWLMSESGIEGLPRLVVDLDLVHRFQAAQAAAERLPQDRSFLETRAAEVLSLEALEWLARYKTPAGELTMPVGNVVPMAPAYAMDLEAFERLAQDVYAEETPAAAPAGPAVA